MARNTVARIDTGALTHNLGVIRGLCPSSRIMAVVKADAYGHRLECCLAALGEADLLAVATLEEAQEIRNLGGRVPVLLLEGLTHPEDIDEVRGLGMEMVVHEPGQIEVLEASAGPFPARMWLKLDSGMHRLGFSSDQAHALAARLLALSGVSELVLMTHFARADSTRDPFTIKQIERFNQAIEGLDQPVSLANSAGILSWPDSHGDWVRAGILLYGISPLDSGDGRDFGLRPVMTLQSELIAINTVAAGESIGYGGRFTAEQDMKVGVVAIGYGDGYPRSAIDGTPVLIRGTRCPLVGRVSMDMITVDVTNLPDVARGDVVTLWGDGLPVEEVARSADTIPYELVCRVTRRVRFEAGAPEAG